MLRRFIGRSASITAQEKPIGKEVKKAATKRLGSFLTPALSHRRELIRSCVSLRIGVSSVTWARLELSSCGENQNVPCRLTHWQHHEVCEKKLHIHELVQRLLYVDYMIPAADCYIFENPQTAPVSTNPGSGEQQNISVQKAQISAILSFAVAKRNSNIDDGASNISNSSKSAQVYYLRRFLTARLFKHLIGAERVSSEETLLRMMRTHYNISEEKDYIVDDEKTIAATRSEHADTSSSEFVKDLRVHVEFNDEQRRMFAQAERYHREFLGQALLLNLAFIRLALLQDPQSIAAVSRGGGPGGGAGGGVGEGSSKDIEPSLDLVRKASSKSLE